MSVLPKLNVPTTLPRWATNPGVTLEPTEGQKNTGWTSSEKPPASRMNWLQNLSYEWNRTLAGMALANSISQEPIVALATTADSLIYNPSIRRWCALSSDATATYISSTGHTWDSYASFFGGYTPPKCLDNWNNGFVAGNFAAPPTAYHLYTQGSGWANAVINWGTDPVAGPDYIGAMATAYPDDNRLLVACGHGTSQLYTRTGTVNGATWTGATTNPPHGGVSRTSPRKMLYLGGNSWALLYTNATYAQAAVAISNNNGLTWTVGTSNQMETYHQMHDLSYNPDTGQLVAAGAFYNAGNSTYYPLAYRSSDLGVSWTLFNFDFFPPLGSLNWGLYAVYYCGGGLWIAAGASIVELGSNIWISADDGVSWGQGWSIYQRSGSADFDSDADIRAIGCDGKSIYLSGTKWALWKTLSLASTWVS